VQDHGVHRDELFALEAIDHKYGSARVIKLGEFLVDEVQAFHSPAVIVLVVADDQSFGHALDAGRVAADRFHRVGHWDVSAVRSPSDGNAPLARMGRAGGDKSWSAEIGLIGDMVRPGIVKSGRDSSAVASWGDRFPMEGKNRVAMNLSSAKGALRSDLNGM
jgi:hypothetical protein